ncbi:neutral/alkaline non-lysosomal ceramidase N-terminal domain-containing protein [candidate division KSB1 bacterium]|nr:neutral/alkaline non-lysosomal ceramidase N-terminal domain-containing protein [candidate division KSB1 bacterium]
MAKLLMAGASAIDITPRESQFLYGYPHVARYSTGVHDPLLASALTLSENRESAQHTQLMFLVVDIIFVSKGLSHSVRRQISERIGIPPENIMISASHTHSGPITVDYISNESDAVVPATDQAYLRYLEQRLIEAGVKAFEAARPARVGFAVADSTGIGTNRHDPSGPADHQVPVLVVKHADTDQYIGCMLVCSMHPTVLHEDSTLISADFPGMARQFLQAKLLATGCPVLHHTGPAGNQSPRHVTNGNTFAEAERLGHILGRAVLGAISKAEYRSDISLYSHQLEIDLPRKTFPSVEAARINLEKSRDRLKRLQSEHASRQEIRTAECDWFGAEETLTLAKAAAEGRLEAAYRSCRPAEIQIFGIGQWTFVGWQGEIFVEYALAVKHSSKNTFVISLANGELQGYIVTPEAAAKDSYEASNSLFSHESGKILVDETLKAIHELSYRIGKKNHCR